MKQYGIAYIVANFENEMLQLKADLEIFITDKDIPLVDRWDIWKNAPSCLKVAKSYYYDMWLGDDHLTDCLSDDYARHESVCMVDFIDRLIENKYCELTEGIPDDECPDQDTWEPEGMDMLKKKILADNMGSFVYDW